jgi:pimeloyl-ACP methyl ester carboxylesterase
MPPQDPIDLLQEFGGDGPCVHLAHANGFPPGTYRPFADALATCRATGTTHAQGYHVIALPARPLWPDSRPESAPSWHVLADDLIQGFDALGLRGIIGVGHSMGGVCTMWAAIRRPDLFRAVVLIDPVILPPNVLRAASLMRWVVLSSRQPLVQGALRRRRTWTNRQACYDRFRTKPFFANWPDQSLWAYVEAGTRPTRDGEVELVYPPEWEAHIFATAPTDVWDSVPQLDVPALIIRGENTDTFRPESQSRMERLLPQARYHVMPDAGHLVPMERPDETAKVVRGFLAGFTSPG